MGLQTTTIPCHQKHEPQIFVSIFSPSSPLLLQITHLMSIFVCVHVSLPSTIFNLSGIVPPTLCDIENTDEMGFIV